MTHLERPKSPLLEFTKDSRGVDKIMDAIQDILEEFVEVNVSDAGEQDSQAWDEAIDHFYGLIQERLERE